VTLTVKEKEVAAVSLPISDLGQPMQTFFSSFDRPNQVHYAKSNAIRRTDKICYQHKTPTFLYGLMILFIHFSYFMQYLVKFSSSPK
jgi:hypothetical protein